jgi:hypothetical protein
LIKSQTVLSIASHCRLPDERTATGSLPHESLFGCMLREPADGRPVPE